MRQLYKTKCDKNYKVQCIQNTEFLRKKLGLTVDQVFTSFQSRLGRTPWITPYTDYVLDELPLKGIKRIAIASPSFTADCLETLEEIKLRYEAQFLQGGGMEFKYIPCLNANDDWVIALKAIVQDYMPNGKSL